MTEVRQVDGQEMPGSLRDHHPRPDGPQEEAGFALIFAVLFVLMMGTFLLFLLSTVTTEVSQTKFALKHEQTLNSAAAGLNAGLNEIRNSINASTGVGVSSALPCQGLNSGSIAGSVNSSGTQTWQTYIYYLNVDPSDLSAAQIAPLALPCPQVGVPKYAYLVSTGHQGAIGGRAATFGDRTLHATYGFATSNAVKQGGQIYYGAYCWDAGPTPAIGTQVTFQPCLAPGTSSQSWYYRQDLSVRWEGNASQNLCLDYRALGTAAAVPPITLQTCVGSGVDGTAFNSISKTYPSTAQMYQEFSLSQAWSSAGSSGGYCNPTYANSYTPGTSTYGAGLAGDLLVMDARYAGSYINCNGPGGAASSFATSAVGAGAAGGGTDGTPGLTQQVVSLLFASRCIDVVGATGYSGFITYPCSEPPDQTQVAGNDQFQYQGTNTTAGTITTVRAGFYPLKCLESAGSQLNTNLMTCVPDRAAQQFTMTGKVVGNYAGSYLIRDYNGNCLTAQTPSGLIGALTLTTCNGSDAQKWNAPPGSAQSSLRGTGED